MLTKRVPVESINIDISFRVRCDISLRASFIVDKRHNNARPSELILNVDEVVLIGFFAISETGVLVLRLHENNRTTIGDLCLRDDGAHLRHVVLGSIEISLVLGPQLARDTLQPAGETAARHFSVDVRSRSCDQVDASFGSSVEEFLEAEDAFGCEVAGGAFEEGPVGVEGHAVVAERFDLLEDV